MHLKEEEITTCMQPSRLIGIKTMHVSRQPEMLCIPFTIFTFIMKTICHCINQLVPMPSSLLKDIFALTRTPTRSYASDESTEEACCQWQGINTEIATLVQIIAPQGFKIATLNLEQNRNPDPHCTVLIPGSRTILLESHLPWLGHAVAH